MEGALSEDDMNEYFTQAEAAEYVRLSETTIKAAVRSKQLQKLKCGKAVRYRKCDLDAWMATKIVGNAADLHRASSESTLSQAIEKTVSAR